MAGSHEEIKEPAAMLEPGMKKPYSTPELVVHGAVEKITEENKGNGAQDAGAMSTSRRSR